jgi:hypothetical protein
VNLVARDTARETWAVFDALDAIFESIAAGGPERLERSHV